MRREIPWIDDAAYTKNSSFPYNVHAKRQSNTVTDFSWVKRWAAVGDSYTAAIGAGRLWGQRKDDYACSRYDRGYPALVNNFLGSHVEDFQYPACSGDRSVNIINQINALKGNLDLVMMTAGGNDLCLAGIVKTCILMSFQSESGCEEVLDIAQNNIDNILKPNIRSLLDALNSKMNDDSVVVFNLYSPFFDAETSSCADKTKEDWTLLPFGNALELTKERRRTFNTLAANANKALKEVVEEFQTKSNIKYKIGWSDWSPWVTKGVSGLMCGEKSSGLYPDPVQPDLQFFKPSTRQVNGHDELKRKRELQLSPAEIAALKASTQDIRRSALWMEPNPQAEVLHKLDPRAPDPPGCPGDGGIGGSIGIPDRWGKYFHPNELGHQSVAAFAIATAISLRGEILDKENPYCEPAEIFTCWQKKGSKGYASSARMDTNYQDFCKKQVKAPSNTNGWTVKKTYHQGTLDEHEFVIKLDELASAFDESACLSAFKKIIHSCDGNDSNNPLNWKFGGKFEQGEYTYEVNVKRTNRPWPPIKKRNGYCEGWYKVFWGEYKIRGHGWAGHDYGQDTLMKHARGCIGGGLTAWKFSYYDEPDEDGNEWGASFNTPIWVRARCFNNNKVQFASDGFTDGCRGND
ncbi:SGNH hydrolase [Eremomyces bilateralis CBS 781.70]|uniref:SGNH hydrolase n=1 Tax=Eremomyces bilateralis CBS 781.70 TaxID=1392243 RepID=A0A6G1G402_9PEZI|nr:SGNH hydrolase [Eremomyces bilateralis CBS 781.70]KAF1812794.1 SGNH hydrolase [Eremomyces bilateralis CBS 781.70]